MQTPHEQSPWAPLQSLSSPGHTRDESQSQKSPDQPESQSHVPQSHVPCPLQLFTQGNVEQLHAGPDHPVAHTHTSHTQLPRGDWHSTGQSVSFRVVQGAHPGSVPNPLIHWHSPHTQLPCDAPPQLVSHGSLEHEQSGPSNRDVHLHSPHSHDPWGYVQFPGQARAELQLQSAPVQGGVHSHDPHEHVPWDEHSNPVELVGQGRVEQLHA